MSGWRDRIFSYEIVPALHSFLFSSDNCAAQRQRKFGFSARKFAFLNGFERGLDQRMRLFEADLLLLMRRVSAALHVNMRAQEACWHVCTAGSCQAFAHVRVVQSAIVLTGAAPACRCDTSKPSRLHLAASHRKDLKARRSRAERKNGRWGQVQDENLTRIRKVVS